MALLSHFAADIENLQYQKMVKSHRPTFVNDKKIGMDCAHGKSDSELVFDQDKFVTIVMQKLFKSQVLRMERI